MTTVPMIGAGAAADRVRVALDELRAAFHTARRWGRRVRAWWRWPIEHRARWLALRILAALMLAPAGSRALAPAAGAVLAAPKVRDLGWHWPAAGYAVALILAVPAVPVAARWAVWQVAEWARGIRWHWTVVRPLAEPLSTLLGTDHWRAGALVQVPRDIDWRQGARVRVNVPRWAPMMQDRRKAVEAIVSSRLGLADTSATWNLRGRTPHVMIGAVSQPPTLVRYRDVLAALNAASETAPVLGLGQSRRPITADLAADSPHLLVSVTTGFGKTTLITSLSAQLLRHGTLLVVCDVKRTLGWLRKLGNVAYLTTPAQIHAALAAVSAEGERRYSAFDAADSDSAAEAALIASWPRVVVIVDELNITMQRLRTWWDSARQPGDPKVTPALGWLSDILLMGRQAKIHAILSAQLGTARSMGGLPELREQTSTRVIRGTVAAWRMLAPEHRPPATGPILGRVHVVAGSRIHSCQIPLITPDEAISYARQGADLWRVEAGTRPDAEGLFIAAERRTVLTAPEPGPALPLPPAGIGLAAACAAEGPLSFATVSAVRKWRTRDPERFPQPVGKAGAELLYDPDELADYAVTAAKIRP